MKVFEKLKQDIISVFVLYPLNSWNMIHFWYMKQLSQIYFRRGDKLIELNIVNVAYMNIHNSDNTKEPDLFFFSPLIIKQGFGKFQLIYLYSHPEVTGIHLQFGWECSAYDGDLYTAVKSSTGTGDVTGDILTSHRWKGRSKCPIALYQHSEQMLELISPFLRLRWSNNN